jgi:hypothetical protein
MFAAEACAPFVGAYVKILGGNRLALNAYLSMFQATAAERVAFEKIQDCFNEEPLTTKLKSPQIMVTSSLIPLNHAANGGRLCTNDQCDH